MILKNILIKNFRSYYGENRFEFSKGLTLIIGDNGDGKTTFFEALEWLFDTAHDNIPTNNVSEKMKIPKMKSRFSPIITSTNSQNCPIS